MSRTTARAKGIACEIGDCQMKIIDMIGFALWGIVSLVCLFAAIINMADNNWQKATFFVAAAVYAKLCYYRSYDDLQAAYKNETPPK